jgi:hypothetical protein
MNPNSQISSEQNKIKAEGDAPLGNFADGLQALMPKIAAAWAETFRPLIMNAPIGPPHKESAENPARPAPQKIALPMQDCRPPISELLEDRKSQPGETIGCQVQLRLALGAEGRRAPPGFGHFDRSDTFCRLAIVSLNVEHPVIRSCLRENNADNIQFFVAVGLVKCLGRDPSALAQRLLAEVKTLAGVAPNQPITTVSLARRLAKSALLEPIRALPIFGQAAEHLVGRSFPLAQIAVRIPVAELGPPWNRPEARP